MHHSLPNASNMSSSGLQSAVHLAPPPLTSIHRPKDPMHEEDLFITSKRLGMEPTQFLTNRRDSDKSVSLDNIDIIQTFKKALDDVVDKRLKDLEHDERGYSESVSQIHYDVFDKWAEGNGLRRYRQDTPNAIQRKTGWAMKTLVTLENMMQNICEGVIICTKCHGDHFKQTPSCIASSGTERMKPAYRPPISTTEQPFVSMTCPEKDCNGILVHKRCKGFFDNPVMHRWHNFNDAIIFESIGVHDHPRPIKDCRNPELSTDNAVPRAQLGCQTTPAKLGLPTDDPSPITEITQYRQLGCQATTCQRPSPLLRYKLEHLNTSVRNRFIGGNVPAVDTINVYSAEGNQLTWDVIRGLPNDMQQAIVRFSVKREEQHVTFSFPFMVDVIQQTAMLDQTPRVNQVTPMLFCDHSMNLMDGFDVVLTLATDPKRCVSGVVHLTVYQSGTTGGVQSHYATLVKIIMQGVPRDVLANLKLPTFVLLNDDIDADTIATPLAEALMKKYADHFVMTNANPTDVILGLKENVILPCIISRPYAFRRSVMDVTSKLPDWETEWFFALAQYLLSDKCSQSELKKANMLLKDPKFVSKEVRQFWAVWGHDLVAQNIFPVAKATWDSIVEPKREDLQSWQRIFTSKSLKRESSLKESLPRLVKLLGNQELKPDSEALS